MRAERGNLNLQRRVTFALGAIVALFVIVQGTLAFLSLEEQEDDLVDEIVLAEARRLVTRIERGEITTQSSAELFGSSNNLSSWLVESSGRASPSELPQYLSGLADGPHRPRRQVGRELHVVVLPTSAGRLYVEYDAEQNEAKVRDFGYYLIAVGALCIAVGVVIARHLAKVVVAPIERLTTLLIDWAPEGSMRGRAESDEETRLLAAFHGVQGRFEQAIAREREFVANVRHEIRTPLAALRTDIELLGVSMAPQSPQQQRIQRALTVIDAITGSLESARALTHRQHVESQPVVLSRLVDDAWSSLGTEPQSSGLRFVNDVPPTTVVKADRHALLTILRNLIRNAAEHASPALCTVRLTPDGVEVADDGPGIAAGDLPFVFDRYYRARLADSPEQTQGDERGLGLAIARQVADLNGWRLSAKSEAGCGTSFVLSLSGAALQRHSA